MHRPSRTLLALILVLPAAATAAADEQQQLPCTRLDHLAGFLEQTYGERPVSAGLQSNGQLLQIFVSGGGSWTAVATSPAGTACVVATGRHWEQAGDPVAEVRTPAAARP
jgi:hypothetical protein